MQKVTSSSVLSTLDAKPDARPINVAVGILIAPGGDVLLARRPVGKPYAGYWEFPGGKVELGEEIFDALRREFMEELGMTIQCAHAWCCVEHVYAHAHVRLHFYLSWEWTGAPQSLENQAFTWQGSVAVHPLLPATIPLLAALDDVRYGTRPTL
ncbi:MAG: NUDIX domain-containing protein [Burkholderiaceae bacterium]